MLLVFFVSLKRGEWGRLLRVSKRVPEPRSVPNAINLMSKPWRAEQTSNIHPSCSCKQYLHLRSTLITTMHTAWVRLNAVVFFGLTVLLGLSILTALSTFLHQGNDGLCTYLQVRNTIINLGFGRPTTRVSYSSLFCLPPCLVQAFRM